MLLMDNLVLVKKIESEEQFTESGISKGTTIVEDNVFEILDIAYNILDEEPPYKIGDNVLLQFTNGTEHEEGMVISKGWIVAVIE